MKQTAVEWLYETLWKQNGYSLPSNILEQAKEMEKKQRQEDTNYGYSQGWDDGNQNKEPMRPELKQQEQ
jgi:hypothetical protein